MHVCTCCFILACVVNVSCKNAAFIHQLFMYVDSLIVSPFRQPNVGHMALPSGTKWQCHNTFGPVCMVDMKVILHHLFVTFVFDLSCNVLHTSMTQGVLVVAKAVTNRGVYYTR